MRVAGPHRTRFEWWNAWSWGDILGHHLGLYDLKPGIQRHFSYVPIMAHVGFWDDPEFHAMVLGWLRK